jgi:spore germination cell wall hydrolase CwlJ-like protein
VAAIPQQPTPTEALALGMKYGPNAGAALQRSQYLAQALQSLEQNAGQNIRTPTALWSNLLADGLMNFTKSRADKEALTAYGADQKSQEDALTKGTPLDPNYPAAASMPSAGAPSMPPPQAPAPQPAPQIAAPPPLAANAGPPPQGVNPQALNLARMVYGEARGEPPEGQQAVAAVALNRARKSGKPLDEILAAPHQFEGYNAGAKSQSADRLASILANIQPALDGKDPTGGAMNFYSPTAQAALGRQPPTWAAGQPHQDIGRHAFFGGNPQAANMQRPASPDQLAQLFPGQAPDPNLAAGIDPNTPPPSPPAVLPGAAGQAPAPPMALQAAGAGAGPAQAPPGTYINPQMWDLAKSYLHDPRTRDKGIAMLEDLKQKLLTPPDPSKPYWGADGQAHYAPGTTFTDQPSPSPNQFVQRGPDNQIHVTANGAYGSVPAGLAMNAHGGLGQLATAEKSRFRIPGAPGFYTLDEKGNPQKVADDNYTVKDVGSTMQELTASPQYDKAVKLTEMYRGATQAAQRAGGISDAELKDNAAQIFSGGVARQFNSKMIDEGQGPWLRLTQVIPELRSGQKISPQGRQAILQAMHDYVTESQGAFGALAQSKSAFASQNGVDLAPFIKPLMRDLPPVPDLSTIPTGINGYPSGQPQANPAQNQAAAIQAEIARRKAAGVWKGH